MHTGYGNALIALNVYDAFKQTYLRTSAVRVQQLEAVRMLFAQLTILRLSGKLMLRLRRIRQRLRWSRRLFPPSLAWVKYVLLCCCAVVLSCCRAIVLSYCRPHVAPRE